jgi:hypothetical protein
MQKMQFRWSRIEILLAHEIVTEKIRQGSATYQGLRIEGKRGFDL